MGGADVGLVVDVVGVVSDGQIASLLLLEHLQLELLRVELVLVLFEQGVLVGEGLDESAAEFGEGHFLVVLARVPLELLDVISVFD